MKKILLTITLVLGINQVVQSSCYSMFTNGAKYCLASLGSGATVMGGAMGFEKIAINKGWYPKPVSQDQLNKLSQGLSDNQDQFNKLTQGVIFNNNQQAELGKSFNSLVDKLNGKQSHWYDSLGTIGAVIGGTLTAYRFLQYSINEVGSFMQIMGLINSLKNRDHNAAKIDEQKQQVYLQQQIQAQQDQGPQKLRPAQRRVITR